MSVELLKQNAQDLKTGVLYVFTGEQASGAEIVIEALMSKNLNNTIIHLFISPGRFADNLKMQGKPYSITCLQQLRKLNRSTTNIALFVFKAVINHFVISYKVVRYAKQHKISVVHANTIVAASYLLPAVIISKVLRLKIKWLWSDHDMIYFKKSDHYFSSLCCKWYNKTLVVSNAVKQKYRNKPKVAVLYNGLDTSHYKPDAFSRSLFRKQYAIQDNTIVFVIAGIISPRKRQLELMQAFSKLNDANQNVLLLLAGDYGTDNMIYNEQVKNLLQTMPNVSYIGHISNMVQLYNGCDVVVNNSSAKGSEPFGATIYEAMSCETLVMAANTGGLPEIVDHNINGFLFNPDDEKALIEMLNYIITHYNQLSEHKKQGRQKVIQKFNFDTILQQYNYHIGINTSMAKNNTTVLQY